MISRVNFKPLSVPQKTVLSTPSFGMAKLNEIGRRAAKDFGFNEHKFLDQRMFAKQIFTTPAIMNHLEDGETFSYICKTYGCSSNGKANAKFINTQILGNAALKQSVDEKDYKAALLSLLKKNYDNGDFSKSCTMRLLEILKDDLTRADSVYVKYAGILDVGTVK